MIDTVAIDEESIDLIQLARRRQRLVAAVIFCGLVLTVFAFMMALGNRALQRNAFLEQGATVIGAALQTSLDIHLESTESVAALFRASTEVTRADFREFVTPLIIRHPGIQAFEWVPRVADVDRVALVDAVRGEGFNDFRFTERDENGHLASVTVREEYFPVLFVEPMAGNEAAFGYADMGDARRRGLETARDGGLATVSSRLVLIQEGGDQFGMIIFVPLYEKRRVPVSTEGRHRQLIGFVEGVFRMRDLVDVGLHRHTLHGLRLMVFDSDDVDDSRPLVCWSCDRAELRPAAMDSETGRRLRSEILAGRHHRRTLTWADRDLELLVYPDADFDRSFAPWVPYLVLVGGLLVNVVLLVYLLLYQARAARVEELVHRRTLALRDSHSRLMQAQKMEMVGRLAGGIAHDFNNLLSAILGNAQLAALNIESDPKEATANLEAVCLASDRAAGLTRQLLTFSRREMVEPRCVDLNTVVIDSQEMLQPILGERIHMTVTAAPRMARVLVDRNQIEQVIVNLAVNGRDAMDGSGRLLVNLSIVPVAGAGDGDGEAGAEEVCLAVRDDGGGMTPETKDRIFEPFFTTKEQGKGTGLGLATVFGIVEQGGGRIEVESDVGRGTCISVFLPLVTDAAPCEEADADMPLSVSKATRRGRILVVEDDEPVRVAVASLLRNAGYEVWTAARGDEALATYSESEVRPELVLSDLIMPGMDGPTMARQLFRRASPPRILFMTGYAAEGMLEQITSLPGIAVLHKPFASQKLLEAIDALLAAPTEGK